jgi:hypothetical protein
VLVSVFAPDYARFAPEKRTFRRYQSDGFGIAEDDETVRRLLGYTKHSRNLGRRRLAGDARVWEG